MSQVALQRSRVSPFVSQDVAGRVSEHVRVNFKRHFGRDAGALDQLLQAHTLNGAPRSLLKTNGIQNVAHRRGAK
jgi:hypothetical protein